MGELHIGPKRDLVNSIRWSLIEVGLPARFPNMLWSQEVPRITSISRITRSIVLRFECQYAFALDVCELLLNGYSLSLISEAWHRCSVDSKARRMGIGVLHIFKQHRARHVLVHNAPLIIMKTLPQSLESCRAVVRRIVSTTPPTASTLSKPCGEMGWGNGKGNNTYWKGGKGNGNQPRFQPYGGQGHTQNLNQNPLVLR